MTKRSKFMSRASVLLAAIGVFVSVAAEAKTVGVAVSKADTFISMLRDSITDRAAQVGGVTLRVEDANGDAAQQIQTIQAFAKDKVDAIIVFAVDGDLGPQMSKIATDANIPLVFVNTQPVNILDLPAKQTYVGSDENEAGTLEGSEVCRQLGGKGRVVVMMGELLHFAARTRTSNVEKVMASKDCVGIEIVEKQSANWSKDQAAGLVGEWLAAGVAFDAVIANNDDMALGAIKGMKAVGAWKDKMIVAGVDATKDGLASMKAGDMKATVLQSATGQGGNALDAAVKMAAGETVPSTIFVPFELVTASNLGSYLAR